MKTFNTLRDTDELQLHSDASTMDNDQEESLQINENSKNGKKIRKEKKEIYIYTSVVKLPTWRNKL